MIPSRPSKLLKRWFGGVVRTRLLRSFFKVRVRGLATLRQQVAEHPVIFVSNHTSWWDPMFLIYLSTRLVPLEGYALMDARNLRKLPFLGRLGGYGVDLDDPEDRSAGVTYSVGLLQAPGTAVWIFPQGRERPVTERPLAFKPGAAIISSRLPGARVLPVGLRYEFGHTEKPFMYVAIGDPLPPVSDVTAGLAQQEAAVIAELDRIDRFLRERPENAGFVTVLAHRASLVGRVLERVLAWFTR